MNKTGKENSQNCFGGATKALYWASQYRDVHGIVPSALLSIVSLSKFLIFPLAISILLSLEGDLGSF